MFDFLKRKSVSDVRKKRAMVFVDFEHWYISLDKMYHTKPDVKKFYDELADRYDIKDMAFFADFSNPSLRAEIGNIRTVSNTIIETQNSSPVIEKDFTDFIMLDHIYQCELDANNNKTDAYVIFTGDGHFSSVASFLVNKRRKEVGIYAVRGAVSNQLSAVASYVKLVPEIVETEAKYEKMILLSLKLLYEKSKGKKPVYPTFWATVETVSHKNNVRREKIEDALRGLIGKGYIYQTKALINKKDTVKVLRVNWQQVHKDRVL